MSRKVGSGRAGLPRRRFIAAAGAWSALAWAPRVFSQSKQPILIGSLGYSSRESGAPLLAALKESLEGLGWKDGAQIRIEERWADGQDDRLTSFTQELAAKRPALIVALDLRTAAYVTKGAPQIPIVMVSGNDPVAGGLVTSLARPGGMITGLAGFGDELSGKHIELLLTVTPKVKRVGFLVPPKGAVRASLLEAARRSAAHHALDARFADAGGPEEIEPAMSRLAKEGAQGLVMLPFALLTSERPRILKLALAQRWPVVGGSAWAEAGALLSYGADTLANHRRAAHYVDRILKGARPGDLPMEQPTKFELVVNLKTAKALGLTIPQSFLMRADRVIE